MLLTSLSQKFHAWDKETLEYFLAIDGVTVNRRRAAYVNADGDTVSASVKSVRVLVDIIAFRLNYPDYFEDSGLSNIANANNRDLIMRLSEDVIETDEIELDGFVWEVKKVHTGTPRVYLYAVIIKARQL